MLTASPSPNSSRTSSLSPSCGQDQWNKNELRPHSSINPGSEHTAKLTVPAPDISSLAAGPEQLSPHNYTKGEKQSPLLTRPPARYMQGWILPHMLIHFWIIMFNLSRADWIIFFLRKCFPWWFHNSNKSSCLLPVHQPPYQPLQSSLRLSFSISYFSQSHTSSGHRKFLSKMFLFWRFLNVTPEFLVQGRESPCSLDLIHR